MRAISTCSGCSKEYPLSMLEPRAELEYLEYLDSARRGSASDLIAFPGNEVLMLCSQCLNPEMSEHETE